MKPFQWIIAMVALVVVIFVIVFAMNFLGENSKQTTPPPPVSVGEFPLAFETTSAFGTADLEAKQPGHQDFAFRNLKDEEVKVGLSSKNCTCAGVEVFLASDEWKRRRLTLLGTQLMV